MLFGLDEEATEGNELAVEIKMKLDEAKQTEIARITEQLEA